MSRSRRVVRQRNKVVWRGRQGQGPELDSYILYKSHKGQIRRLARDEALDLIARELTWVARLERRARKEGKPWPPDDEEVGAWSEALYFVRSLREAEARSEPREIAALITAARKEGLEPFEAYTKPGASKRRRRDLLNDVARDFTVRARDARVVLEVQTEPKSGTYRLVVKPLGVRAQALALLWRYVFADEAWKRFRPCAGGRCDAWCADRSDSHTRRFCSNRCRYRWNKRQERRRKKSQAKKQALSATRR